MLGSVCPSVSHCKSSSIAVLSPEGLGDSHMVLPLDILNESTHADTCVEILKEFGRVRGSFVC